MIRLFTYGLLAGTVLLLGACRRSPSAETIASAMGATNAFFLARQLSPLALSQSQLRRLKDIVNRFNRPDEVRIERRDDRVGFSHGVFELDSVRFMWEGGQLYVGDPTSGGRFYVEDVILGQMSKRYMGAMGDAPPLRELSSEQWQTVISILGRPH